MSSIKTVNFAPTPNKNTLNSAYNDCPGTGVFYSLYLNIVIGENRYTSIVAGTVKLYRCNRNIVMNVIFINGVECIRQTNFNLPNTEMKYLFLNHLKCCSDSSFGHHHHLKIYNIIIITRLSSAQNRS